MKRFRVIVPSMSGVTVDSEFYSLEEATDRYLLLDKSGVVCDIIETEDEEHGNVPS